MAGVPRGVALTLKCVARARQRGRAAIRKRPLPRLWTRSLTLYGLRPEFLEKSGALLFIWTLYVLGVTGGLSVILAVQALRDRRVAHVLGG